MGVDYSGRFLDAAISLQSGTRGQGVLYLGEDGQKKKAILPEGVNANRAMFKQVSVTLHKLTHKQHATMFSSVARL